MWIIFEELLSCNVIVAKSCSQHIVLVIWIEFPPKPYQVTLPLARKEELPKWQEIPTISAGGKNQLLLPLVDVTLKKKKSQTRLAAMDYLDRKRCSRNFLHSKMANFVLPVTLSSTTFSDSSGLRFIVCDNRNQNQQTEMLKKGVNSTTKTRKWASATLVWSLNPWISCVWSILSKGISPPPSLLISMACLPRYQKTYLLCIISLEYSSSVKKKPKISQYFKKSLKIIT